MKHKPYLLLILLTVTVRAQETGKVVQVAQTDVRGHSVHVLVCTLSEPRLRIVLACTTEINGLEVPNCVQPLAGERGYMKTLTDAHPYNGRNVSVDWQEDRAGVYLVQDSSVEKCEISR